MAVSLDNIQKIGVLGRHIDNLNVASAPLLQQSARLASQVTYAVLVEVLGADAVTAWAAKHAAEKSRLVAIDAKFAKLIKDFPAA